MGHRLKRLLKITGLFLIASGFGFVLTQVIHKALGGQSSGSTMGLFFYYKLIYIMIGAIILGFLYVFDQKQEEKERNAIFRVTGLLILMQALYYSIRALIVLKMSNLEFLLSFSLKEQLILLNQAIQLFYILYAVIIGVFLLCFTYYTEELRVISLRFVGLALMNLGFIVFFTFISHILIGNFDSPYFLYPFSFYEIIYLLIGIMIYRYTFKFIFYKKEEKIQLYTFSNQLLGVFLLLLGFQIFHDRIIVALEYHKINDELPQVIIVNNKMTDLYDYLKAFYLTLMGTSLLLFNRVLKERSHYSRFFIKYLTVVSVLLCILIGSLSIQKPDQETLKSHIKVQVKEVFKPKPNYYVVDWKIDREVDIETMLETSDHALLYIGSGSIIKQDLDGKELWRVSSKVKGIDIIEFNNHYYILSYDEDSRVIVKYDLNGKLKNSFILPEQYNHLTNLAAKDDHLIIAGVKTQAEDNLQVITMSQSGEILSDQNETLKNEPTGLSSLLITNDDQIIIHGTIQGQSLIASIDLNSGVNWENRTNWGEYYNHVTLDQNQNILAFGLLRDDLSKSYVAVIKKFDTDGNFTELMIKKNSEFEFLSHFQPISEDEYMAVGRNSMTNQVVICMLDEEELLIKKLQKIDLKNALPQLITADGSVILKTYSYGSNEGQIIKLSQADHPIKVSDYLPLILFSTSLIVIIGIPIIRLKRRPYDKRI
jgi:hypothetical protein